MENQSVIAGFQPQVPYAIFIHSLVSSWNYVMRTVLNIEGCCSLLRMLIFILTTIHLLYPLHILTRGDIAVIAQVVWHESGFQTSTNALKRFNESVS